MKKRFYAVRQGHKPGIYQTWEECRVQVEGYPKAVYKGFPTLQSAQEYLNGSVVSEARPATPPETKPLYPDTSESADNSLKQVVIYADGACTGNPGPGGYGVLINYGGRQKELSAGFRLTTNNRMEILGCLAGLAALKEPCNVTLYSDSRYVVNTMAKSWAQKWKRNGWKRRDKNGEMTHALNRDLWVQMLDLCEKHNVEFKWIRGHDGNEGNERCDQLARAAAASHNLGVDSAYENPSVQADATVLE